MMARSTNHSNQRPDTLMQDRKAARSTKPLATHGRTIQMGHERRFRDVRDQSGLPPTPERLRQRSEPTLRAKSRPGPNRVSPLSGELRKTFANMDWQDPRQTGLAIAWPSEIALSNSFQGFHGRDKSRILNTEASRRAALVR